MFASTWYENCYVFCFFLARARYENCSPSLKLSSCARASFTGIVVLSYRGAKYCLKNGGVARELNRPMRCTGTVRLEELAEGFESWH